MEHFKRSQDQITSATVSLEVNLEKTAESIISTAYRFFRSILVGGERSFLQATENAFARNGNPSKYMQATLNILKEELRASGPAPKRYPWNSEDKLIRESQKSNEVLYLLSVKKGWDHSEHADKYQILL